MRPSPRRRASARYLSRIDQPVPPADREQSLARRLPARTAPLAAPAHESELALTCSLLHALPGTRTTRIVRSFSKNPVRSRFSDVPLPQHLPRHFAPPNPSSLPGRARSAPPNVRPLPRANGSGCERSEAGRPTPLRLQSALSPPLGDAG